MSDKPMNPPFVGDRRNWSTEERASDITLRDLFATAALAGMLSYPGDPMGGSAYTNSTPEKTTRAAYVYADAMLRAREESQ